MNKKNPFIRELNKIYIVLYSLVLLSCSLVKETENDNCSKYISIVKDSVYWSTELQNNTMNKLVLRLKDGYCDGCINSMLDDVEENPKLNDDNFIIITQFNDNRALKQFKQYTTHKVLNYSNPIMPMDTLLNSNSYFFINKNDKLRVIVFEYIPGYPYQEFISKIFDN